MVESYTHSKIENCPFCNAVGKIVEGGYGDEKVYYRVRCYENCKNIHISGDFLTRKEVVDDWNDSIESLKEKYIDKHFIGDDCSNLEEYYIKRLKNKEKTEYIIKNAIITKAVIKKEETDVLTAYLVLDLGDCELFSANFVLYLSPKYKNHNINSLAGHFIFRVLEIANVDRWECLEGKPIKVALNKQSNKVVGFCHLLKEDWFYPSIDFKNIEKENRQF